MPSLNEILDAYLDGYIALAREWLEQEIPLQPSSELYSVYFDILLVLRRYDQADEVLKLLENLGYEKSLYLKALRFRRSGHLETALDLYLQCNDFLGATQCSLGRGNFGLAGEYAHRVITDSKKPYHRALAYLLLGKIHRSFKRYAEAQDCFSEAARVDSSFQAEVRPLIQDAKEALTFCHARQNRIILVGAEKVSLIKLADQADVQSLPALGREICERFLEENPEHIGMSIQYSQQLKKLGLCVEAEPVVSKLEKHLPKNWSVAIMRAQLYQHRFYYYAAKAAFLKAAELFPQCSHSFRFCCAHGMAKISGDPDRVNLVFAVTTHKDQAVKDEAWANLGGHYLAIRDYDKARDCYLRALAIDPADAKYKHRLEDLNKLHPLQLI